MFKRGTGYQMIEIDQEIPGKSVNTERSSIPSKFDPLLISIPVTAFALTILVVVAALFADADPILAKAPWYVPLVCAFISLTTLSVSYLALGRYQVLRDPLSFWVGSGFATYAVGQIFIALTWPGLLSGERSILGHFANTSTWIGIVDLALIDAFLLAATVVRWPGSQSLVGERWVGIVAAGLLIATTGFGSIIFFESRLAVLVSENGQFTLPPLIWIGFLLFAFLAGSILSARYYRQGRDKLAGFIAFPQLALAFVCMMILL